MIRFFTFFTRISICLIVVFFSVSRNLWAQYLVAQYAFNQNSGVYTPISGGTVLGTAFNDDQIFHGTTSGTTGLTTGIGFPIGFPFTYEGETFTRFAVATNGYVRLGNGTFPLGSNTTAAFSANPTNQADTANFLNLLAPFHANIEGQSGAELSFLTSGTAPNRELVIQWKNYMFLNATGIERLNFQVRLQEFGNRIVFSYGEMVKNSTNRTVSVGIRGGAYRFTQMRRARIDTAETWETSSTSFNRAHRCDVRVGFVPTDGLEFEFAGPSRPPVDLALVGLNLSSSVLFGCQGSTTEAVGVSVKNYGTNPATTLNYTYQLNGGALATGTVPLTPDLAPGESRKVTLSETANLSSPGNYSFRIWASTPGDSGYYRINDTIKTIVPVFAPMTSPAGPITNLAGFGARGWNAYRGKNRPERPGGKFVNSSAYFSQTTMVAVPTSTADTVYEWMVSPAIVPNAGQILKFRASINRFDTTTVLSSMSDDEINVMVSTDCGASWTALLTFNNTSLTSGVINNVRRGYSVPLTGFSGPFQLAFFVYNKGNAGTLSYNVHFDDVAVSQGNAYDLAARKMVIENQGNPTCSQTTFPVRLLLKNLGDSTLTSSNASVRVNTQPAIIQNFTFTPPLGPGDSVEVLFPSVTMLPNNLNKVVCTARLSLEDGYSASNDTVSQSFTYLGSASPLALPSTTTFEGLPLGIPADWLVEQSQGTDFKIRVRGAGSSRSLSANMYLSNKSSFAVMPVTQVLPANYRMLFDVRLKNDLAGFPYTIAAGDSLIVSISTNCGAGFTPVFKINSSNPFGVENFAQAQINLSGYAGQVVNIRFDAYMDRTDFSGAWVDLDNINFSPTTSVSSLLDASDVSVFPNPASTSVNLKIPASMEGLSFRILSVEGKELQTGVLHNDLEINLTGMPKGLYTVELSTGAEPVRKKLVVQ